MSSEVILGLIRHILTGAGSILVAKGYTDTAGLESAVGAVLTLAGLVWSAMHKKGVQNQIEAAAK